MRLLTQLRQFLNKAGLDQNASISSRAFELYVQQKTPIEVAIALNLEAKEAIRFHQEYIMLLGLSVIQSHLYSNFAWCI
jgi:hypothetical protein